MIRCNTGQQCTYSWSSMRTTQEQKVRFCPQCQQTVHWVDSYVEFKDAAQKTQCIAFEPANVLVAAGNRNTGKTGRKQFLVLKAQKLSLKQLVHLKKYLHFDLSLRELRDTYHNQSAVIKYDPNKDDIEKVAESLRGLGISIEAKREETA